MASGISGAQNLRVQQGIGVYRATSALGQTGNQTLFTVSGGLCIVTTMVGEVTTAVQAQANALLLRSVSTSGSITTLLMSSFETNALALGTLLSVPGLPATAPVTGGMVTQGNEFVVPAGIIQANYAASNTGAIRWTLTYVPLTPGAAIVAS